MTVTLNVKLKFCFDECKYDQYQYLNNKAFQAQNLGLTAAKESHLILHLAGQLQLLLSSSHVLRWYRVA